MAQWKIGDIAEHKGRRVRITAVHPDGQVSWTVIEDGQTPQTKTPDSGAQSLPDSILFPRAIFSPIGEFVRSGARSVRSGAGRAAGGATIDERMGGVAEMIGGGLQAVAPAAAAVGLPLAIAGGLPAAGALLGYGLLGMAAGKAAKEGARFAGAGPGAQALAGELGTLAGGAPGIVRALRTPFSRAAAKVQPSPPRAPSPPQTPRSGLARELDAAIEASKGGQPLRTTERPLSAADIDAVVEEARLPSLLEQAIEATQQRTPFSRAAAKAQPASPGTSLMYELDAAIEASKGGRPLRTPSQPITAADIDAVISEARPLSLLEQAIEATQQRTPFSPARPAAAPPFSPVRPAAAPYTEAEIDAVIEAARRQVSPKGATKTKSPPAIPPAQPPGPPPVSPRRRKTQRGSIVVQTERGPEDDFMNFRVLSLTAPEEEFMRDWLRKEIAAGQLKKTIEPHRDIQIVASGLNPNVAARVAEGGKRPEGIVGRGVDLILRQRTNRLNSELMETRRQLANSANTLSADALERLQAREMALDHNLKQYHGVLGNIKSEHGRNLRALAQQADSSLDLDVWMMTVKRARKLPANAMLPEKVQTRLQELVDQANRAADKTAARQALVEFAASQAESGWLETIVTLTNANLISGIKTTERNIGGTAAFQVAEELARIPAVMFDIAQAAVTRGPRTVAGPSMRAMIRAGRYAATQGMRDAQAAMRGTPFTSSPTPEVRELNFRKLYDLAEKTPDEFLAKVLRGTNAVINAWGKYPFRFLNAQDRVSKAFAFHRSLEAMSRVQAINEARSGKILKSQIEARTNELLKAPPESMAAEALLYSEFATFTSPNALAQAVSRGESALGPVGQAVGRWIVPFRNTPAEIFSRQLDYTPAGAIWRAGKAVAQGGPSAEVRKKIAEAFGRGALGSMIILKGYNDAAEGKATGLQRGLTAERTGVRRVHEAAGRQKGSFLDDGEWKQVLGFAPIGNLYVVGATLHELGQRRRGPADLAAEATMAGAATSLEQPMMAGLADTIDVLRGQRSPQTFATQQAGRLVPTIVAEMSSAYDPVRREFPPPKGSSITESIQHGVQLRLPSKENLQPAVDVLGYPSATTGRASAFNAFLPRQAKETQDPFFRELVSLGIGVSGPARIDEESDAEFRARKRRGDTAGPEGKVHAESEEEFLARRVLVGALIERELRNLMAAPGWQNIDKEEKARLLSAKAADVQRTMTNFVKSREFQDLAPDLRVRWLRENAANLRPESRALLLGKD